MIKSLLPSITLMLLSLAVSAQSLMDELEKTTPAASKKEYATATFKSTRLLNGMTVENLGAGVLDFRIDHRFGQISQGAYNFYGVDDATTMLSLDYGITKWLMVGLGHAVTNKEYNGFIKAKLLRQQKGAIPVTASYAFSTSEETLPAPILPTGDTWKFSNRLFFTHQLIIGRKFSDAISFQIMPSLIHYNLVDSNKWDNNCFVLGAGGRIKVTKRMAVTGEYFYRLNNTAFRSNGAPTFNSFSLGVEIETGGHVFQLVLTNSASLTERMYVCETTDSWSKGQLHIGFNISRVFTVIKPKEFKNDSKW